MRTLKELMKPIWDTDIVYEESLTFIQSKGKASAPLLYKPKKIIAVKNARLDMEFYEGIDWTIQEDKILLTPNSRIFSFPEEDLYPKQPLLGHSFPTEDGNLLFYEEHFFHDRQTVVTYTCENGQWNGIKPVYSEDKLPATISKLKNGEALTVVLYGDSISVGANASKFTDCPPYTPSWGELLIDNLKVHYGSKINFHNPSVGGKDSAWGAENADILVNTHNPDLTIIAFGGNDVLRAPSDFAEKIKSIINTIREKYPESEFILVATSLPNPLLTSEKARFWGNQHLFAEVLMNIEGKGIITANITEMHKELLKRKRYIDMTGNNVNHPNDFLHRCHAQFISGLLISDE